ncbi:MAG: YceI family protein [Pseudomonadota bacterium]
MLNTLKSITLTIALAAAGTAGFADGHAKGWTLDGENSKLSFGSVKKEYVGEVHTFEDISGTVGADGAMAIDVNLASVETYIDIRNTRMIEHVFKDAATATIASQIDMEAMNALAVGDMAVMDFDGTLSLIGTDVDLYTEVFVVRLSEDRMMATTDSMVFLDAEEAGIDAGITKLMELAELPSITRAAPVTLRLVFDAN